MRSVGILVVLVVGIGVLVLAGREVAAFIPAFSAWVAALGAWGPLAFIAGYALAPVVLAPAFLLTIAGGAIFGFGKGMLYVMIGATIGSTLAFLIGRHLARRFVEQLLKRDPRLAAIDRAVETQGLRLILLLRLSPLVPFVLLNYALGLSRVRLTDFIVGNIGLLPVVAMYVYTGKLAGDIAALASGAAPARGPLYYVFIAAGFAATVAVTVVATRIARQVIDAEMATTPVKAP